MTRKQRQTAEKQGRMAEHLVAFRLRCKGWRMQQSRYHSAYGKIDLIMQKPQRLLFVEVKYTSQTDDDALEQILPASRQRRRIYDTANYFLSEHPAMSLYEMRFVVALVRPYGRIRFIEDHFFDTI